MTALPTRDRVPQLTRGPAAVPRSGAASPAGAAGMTSSDIFRILRRRKLLIFLCTSIVSVLVAAATLIWDRFMPFYTASAYLEVEAPKTSELQISSQLQSREIMDTIKMSHAKLVTAEESLRKSIEKDEKERIKKTLWYRDNQGDPIRGLIDEIKVAPITGTNFIQLSMTGTNRLELPEIVNAVAEAYVVYSQETIQTTHQGDITRLNNQQRSLQEALERVRAEAVTERPEDAPQMQSNYTVQDLKLQDITKQMLDLEAKQTEAKADMAMIEAQDTAGSLPNSPEIQQALEMDGSLRSLQFAKSDLLTRRDALLDRFGPEHRVVKEFETRLQAIEREIESKTQDVVSSQVRGLKEARRMVLKIYTERLVDVQAKYDEAIANLRDTQSHLVRLEGVKKEEQAILDKIRLIDQRLLDMGLLSGGGQRVVFIAAYAPIPRDPSMPKWRIMMPMGIFFGLILGLGTAFLLELVDTSIKTPTDISRRVDLPLLGMVPHAEDLEEDIEELRLAFRSHPNSLIGEAFRQIHTCLLFSGPASQRRSLLITSPSPQDGRTTVSVNLAAAVARTGRRILLVDTNFRQPMIKHLFPLCGEQGLSSALVGHVPWRDLVHRIEDDFDVLPAGQLPPNPAEMLSSDSMRNIIAEMAGQYDQIIFDSAPCTVVTDALGFGTMVDGVILVVRAGSNTYGIVQRTRDMLNRVGCHLIGVVLNGVRATPGGYLRKNYETFYQYHEQAKLAPAEGKVEVPSLPDSVASAK